MANQGQTRPPPLPREEVSALAVPAPPVAATVEEAFEVAVTSAEVAVTSVEVAVTSSEVAVTSSEVAVTSSVEVAVTAVNEDHQEDPGRAAQQESSCGGSQ